MSCSPAGVAENCTHLKIFRAVGFTNDHLYAETPDWLIRRLRRVAVEPEERAEFASEPAEIGEPANEAASPLIHEMSRAAPLVPEVEITRGTPEIARDTSEAASFLRHETSHAAPLAVEIIAETNGASLAVR